MTLDQQHIVVFGGSSGLGLAVGQAALAAGAKVTLIARNAERLHAAAQRLAAPPHRLRTLQADITDAAAVVQAIQAGAPPDHVYVAAGAFVGGSVLTESVEHFRSALDARLWGAVHAVRAAAPLMRGPASSFVFTGAISTDRPAKGAWATAVATAASEQLARALAVELAPLRFNAMAPGWTDTPMWDSLLGDAKANTFATVGAQIPVGHLASADDVAQAVLLLMANRSLNGEVLHVDGGHRLV